MYTMSHTEDYIKNMYLHIGILRPQQLDYQQIARKLGIKIFYWEDTSQALFLKELACIFLNKKLTKQQMWQDFCHELAHVLMHSGHQARLPPLFVEYQESKANNFMYHACIPTYMLNDLKINDFLYSTVLSVSKLFQVEYDFALKRLTQYIQNKRFMQNLHRNSLQHM